MPNFCTTKIDVADGAELVGVARGAVVDDGEGELRVRGVVGVGPLLEVGGELVVRDNEDLRDAGDGREVVNDPLHHRLAGDAEERLRFREREGIEACRVARGEDEDVHEARGGYEGRAFCPTRNARSGTGACVVNAAQP